MTDPQALREALFDLRTPLRLVRRGGTVTLADGDEPPAGFVPALLPEDLGDPSFRGDHRLRYPHAAGAMANGIASTDLVEAMARAGMLSFFGAAGLPPERVEAAVDRLQTRLGDTPHGYNLIHSPNEPDLEAVLVDLYLRRRVGLVEASAYL